MYNIVPLDMVRPGLVEKLHIHHRNLEATAAPEKWVKWSDSIVEYCRSIGNINSSLWRISEDTQTNAVKKVMYEWLIEDVYGVLKDVKLCNDFGFYTRSVYICHQLLSPNSETRQLKSKFIIR